MHTPDNSWMDKSGSSIPAYKRKEASMSPSSSGPSVNKLPSTSLESRQSSDSGTFESLRIRYPRVAKILSERRGKVTGIVESFEDRLSFAAAHPKEMSSLEELLNPDLDMITFLGLVGEAQAGRSPVHSSDRKLFLGQAEIRTEEGGVHIVDVEYDKSGNVTFFGGVE